MRQIYEGYDKNFSKQNSSFQKDLQIYYVLFFHRRYTLPFIHQKRGNQNQNFNFPARIYDMENILRNEIIYSKNLDSFGVDHFFIDILSFVY